MSPAQAICWYTKAGTGQAPEISTSPVLHALVNLPERQPCSHVPASSAPCFWMSLEHRPAAVKRGARAPRLLPPPLPDMPRQQGCCAPSLLQSPAESPADPTACLPPHSCCSPCSLITAFCFPYFQKRARKRQRGRRQVKAGSEAAVENFSVGPLPMYLPGTPVHRHILLLWAGHIPAPRHLSSLPQV